MENTEEFLKNLCKRYEDLQEIRLRADKPVGIVIKGSTFFIDEKANIEKKVDKAVSITKNNIYEIFMKLCKHSIHAYKEQIKEGYITTDEGHRVGIAGKLNSVGNMSALDITSLNIRIARQIKGASEEISQRLFKERVNSTLIIGEPSSGKTTILRDLAIKLTSGYLGKSYKTVIIDSRNEIGAYQNGKYTYDVGINTDIITGIDKSEGIMQAIRTMSPQIIICDEMGGIDDVVAVNQCLNSGVNIITTVHAGSKKEAEEKEQILALINSGAFKNVVLLQGADNPSAVKSYGRIVKNDKDLRNYDDSYNYIIVWDK